MTAHSLLTNQATAVNKHMKRTAEDGSLSEDEQDRRDAYKSNREKRRLDSWHQALRDDAFRQTMRRTHTLQKLQEERVALMERYIKSEPRNPQQAKWFAELQEIADEQDDIRESETKLDLKQPVPDTWTEHGFPSSSGDSDDDSE